MSQLYCVKLITNYYDSIISKIDVYTEELLETIDPNNLIDETTVGKCEYIFRPVSSGFEKYLNQTMPNFTFGSTRTVDYINSIRKEMIDRVNKCQQDTLDFYHENRKDFEMDPKEMEADKEEELKRRLFGKTFCFVVNIECYKKYLKKTYFTNKCLFNLYLIVCDHFVDQNAIDYIRFILESSQTENFDPGRLEKLFTDCRILVINSLVDCVFDCLVNSIGHQHLIDIEIEHLLAKKDVTLRLTKLDEPFSVELSPSSALDFTNLESLEITSLHEVEFENYGFNSIGPFPNLSKLCLSNIHIVRESQFENLTNLRHLVLTNFILKYSELDFSKLMPNLEVVEFDYIEICSNGKITGFNKLSKLEKIEFRYLRGQELSFFANSNVSYLIFKNSRKHTENLNVFSNFPNLKHLEINWMNENENVIDLDFKCESKLETLLLKINGLKSIGKQLNLHKNLKRLDLVLLYHYKINPEVFEGLTQLEEFTLMVVRKHSRKEFKDIITNTLKHFPNLRKLSLSCNLIENLDPELFVNKPKLTHLDLSSNKLILKRGDFRYLSSLKYLNLRNNGMNKLEDGVFMGLDYLEEIDLEGNQLDEESLRQLDQLKWLKSVNFQITKFNKKN